MSGKRIKVGARQTYFPPFVNERFDPPFWACTFAALLNGANVGFLGNKPPTHDEVKKLAAASGDPDLGGGANSSEMLRAMKVHYNKTMHLEALSSARARERLSSGWALVASPPLPGERHVVIRLPEKASRPSTTRVYGAILARAYLTPGGLG